MVSIIDAVMGRGKSTWAIERINANDNNRYIVVLPGLTEIERYLEGMIYKEDVVALHEDAAKSKQQRFQEALEDARVILITHCLFEDYLKPNVFRLVSQGDWHLILDETISTFEPIKGLSKTIVDGWVVNGIVTIQKVNEGLSRIDPEYGKVKAYLLLKSFHVSNIEKVLLKQSLTKELLMLEDTGEQGFFIFNLNKRRLEAFRSVTILTYMFRDSDMYCWFNMNGIEFDHKELTEEGELKKHEGKYTGKQFASLVEVLEPGCSYGRRPNHLSATCSRGLKSKNRSKQEFKKGIQRDLARHFRNRRRGVVKPEDFMFTCLSECKGLWANRGKNLPATFIGENTWVQYGERGVNGYGHIHNLAYLYNVYQNPAIVRTVNSYDGLNYNEDAYALSVLIQWIWRSAVRNGEKIRVYIPSKRMRGLLVNWLNA